LTLEKYEEGPPRRGTPLSYETCMNCIEKLNGTCCGSNCCRSGTICCQSVYSSL